VIVDVLLESDGLYGTYGYVGVSNESIIIAFRGSSSIQNWFRDLEMWMTPYPAIPGAEVHYGFLDTYTVVMPMLRASVKKLSAAHPSLPILVTGHSLGAAQSVLAAVDLGLLGYQNINLINFGQPRVGNDVFAATTVKLINNHYRAVNMADLVPHFPIEDAGYVHHPQEIWFQNNGLQWTLCDASNGEDPSCSDSLEPWEYRPTDHMLYLDIDQNIQNGHGCGLPPFEAAK
jgi:predicted lipase